MEYCYKYPRPAITVDAIVVAKEQGTQEMLLLIQRKSEPYKGKWALPGGFVDVNETLKEAATRELKEETGVEGVDLKQFNVFDAPGRDPRERTISVVHFGYTDKILTAKGSDDAQDARWFPLSDLPELAFDHEEIVERFVANGR